MTLTGDGAWLDEKVGEGTDGEFDEDAFGVAVLVDVEDLSAPLFVCSERARLSFLR